MMRHPLAGLLTAFLLLSLTACVSRQTIDAPDSLLLDTPIPVAAGRTNNDLQAWANSLYCALVQANEDKAALRALKDGNAYTPTGGRCDPLQ